MDAALTNHAIALVLVTPNELTKKRALLPFSRVIIRIHARRRPSTIVKGAILLTAKNNLSCPLSIKQWMKVRKYSGELEVFDVNRLKHSLSKSGASDQDVEDVLQAILPGLHEGMPTKDIYKLAFRFLKKKANSFAARYSLKRALMELGPAGYHFEKWVAKLFDHLGYQTATSQKIAGNAVSHEVDVVAQRLDEQLLIECKFRNAKDAKISVTTPMYFLSRFTDTVGKQFPYFGRSLPFSQGWLVTNTYWTKDAISFGEYYGIRLLGWDYPAESSIKVRVDSAGLYPITCLTTLVKRERETLLLAGCILVNDLLQQPQLLDTLAIQTRKKKQVIAEAKALVNNPINSNKFRQQ